MNKIISPVLSLFLVFSFFVSFVPQTVSAQTAKQTQISADLQNRLAKIEEKLEARRKELGIPGMSLAIVKDGEVILSKGYGYKSFEKQIPVTADTQFAIGSASKAFTALSVLMSADEGKLSLDENPRKYLPYFKINDAEINEKITVRNLLTHSSGLNRTDLGWISGKLTREEIIKVAGEAKPVAKLGEKFLYQNVMYAAAGQIVSDVQNMTWENYVAQKIFKPIGMLNSNLSIPEMQKAKDYSFGYEYNFDTKKTTLLPTRHLAAISPAGSINSSANDMAKWLNFVLNKGAVDGKRIVSERGFEEWIKPHQKISPDGKFSYALGWFVQNWNGKKVVQHGGNIDGFNSMVALLPEENLGFVMLTNVSGSSLGNDLMPIIWNGILSEETKPENQTASTDAEKEVGKYRFTAANFDIEVKIEDGKLVAIAPGQPVYTLEKVEGRRYKLGGAPDGFFITFKDDSAFLEQPQGNYTLPKVGAETKTDTSSASAKELIGKYESEQNKGNFIEIKMVDEKASLVVGNQPPYPLIEKEKNLFRSPLLPDSYSVKVKRTGENKIEGITLVQPEGEFPFKYIADSTKNPHEIFGSYKLEQPPNYIVEILKKDGKIYLKVPDQPIYELMEKEKDVYFSPTIPNILSKIEFQRDADGKIIKFISNEPSGAYTFRPYTIEKPKITVDELMTKTIAALGGEENLRKINSRVTEFDLDLIHQGVKGYGKVYEKAPNMSATETTVTALGKKIATIEEYFDGTNGGEKVSFSRNETYTGQRLEDVKFGADFYRMLDWKKDVKSTEITGIQKVGDEETYVLKIQPEKASPVTYYISTKTFLPVKVTSLIVSSTSSQKIPFSQTLSDYRQIDGIMIPFKSISENPGMGEIVTYVKEVKHNVKIADKEFKP